jgi:hypothetical protein
MENFCRINNDDIYSPFYLFFIFDAIIEKRSYIKDDRLLFFLSDCTTEPFPSSVPPESISIQYSGSSMAEGGVITLEEGKLETVLCITRYFLNQLPMQAWIMLKKTWREYLVLGLL